ncbi:MAG: AAA family ATPase [Desulfovibrionaceae bacterium]|nr:AAA family ATPase [Desulfovibrionaceae bacterium]
MKTALVLNLVDPTIGGVLIRGEKGTAKSTAVRGLALLLPEMAAVAGCRFACDPAAGDCLCPDCAARVAAGEALETERRRVRVVDLPVGSTEDRVLGTLDLEWAIKKGERRFEPGILAEANRSILYVDEVNLLDDHIVDVLLDAAAMGVNTVERESVSFSHPARFVLVGTMNPEEGELRPQLLDRFGLCVEVRGIMDLEARVELVRRRAAFEADPAGFCAAREAEERRLGERIVAARERVPSVEVCDDVLRNVAEIAIGMNVDGHRADLVMVRAARALAALEGREAATREDVKRAAEMALPHRMRKKPFQKIGLDADRVDAILGAAS